MTAHGISICSRLLKNKLNQKYTGCKMMNSLRFTPSNALLAISIKEKKKVLECKSYLCKLQVYVPGNRCPSSEQFILDLPKSWIPFILLSLAFG